MLAVPAGGASCITSLCLLPAEKFRHWSQFPTHCSQVIAVLKSCAAQPKSAGRCQALNHYIKRCTAVGVFYDATMWSMWRR